MNERNDPLLLERVNLFFRSMQVCAYCDGQFRKGLDYNTHFEQCVESMTRQQQELESQIMGQMEQQTAEVRGTRTRSRVDRGGNATNLDKIWMEDGYSSGLILSKCLY